MSSTEPAIGANHPVLTRAEPQLFVTDMDRAIRYFRDTLGFSVSFVYGEPAFYGQVRRDAAVLNLRHVDTPILDRGGEPDLLSASITVERLRPLFRELQGRGAVFHQTLTQEPWHQAGQGQFVIADPDGNLILFAGRTG